MTNCSFSILDISSKDQISKDGTYSISITDTGIGIPAEEINTIFDRFKKAHTTGSGYGLGLAIVKSIAAYHHILLNVKSEVNKSTTFTLTFPKEAIKYR